MELVHLEPQWPLFLKVDPPKQGLFQSKQGSFGFQVCRCTYICNENNSFVATPRYSFWTNMFTCNRFDIADWKKNHLLNGSNACHMSFEKKKPGTWKVAQVTIPVKQGHVGTTVPLIWKFANPSIPEILNPCSISDLCKKIDLAFSMVFARLWGR